MADQISIGANFQKLIAGTTEAVKGFGRLEDAVIKTAKAGSEFELIRDDKTGEVMVKRLKESKGQLVQMNKEGKTLTTNFIKSGGQWSIISSYIKESATAAERIAKATQRSASSGLDRATSLAAARQAELANAVIKPKASSGTDRATSLAIKKQDEIRAAIEVTTSKELTAINTISQARNRATERAANKQLALGAAREVRDAAELSSINKLAAARDRVSTLAAEKQDAIRLRQEALDKAAPKASSGTDRATKLAADKQKEIQAAIEATSAKELAASNKLAARKKQTEADLTSFKQDQNAKALADGIAKDKKRVDALKAGIIQSNKEREQGQKLLAESQANAQKAAKRREKAITDQILKSRAVWETLIKLQLSNIATRVFQNIVQDLREAVTLAGQLSKSVSQISTIDVSNTSLSTINSELLELSNLSGLDVLDVANAQYQALSNQVVNAGESFEFLKTSNELAIASLATSEQSVNLLSSTINAFQLSASSAGKIADSFFKTVELGRLKIGDIASSFGRSAVLANQLGVTLNETQATLALFTRQGIKASQASTLMRSIFLKLIKPTGAMIDFLSDLGFESGQAAIKSLGFAGVMKLVEAEAVRTGNALGDLGEKFSRVRAITGAAIFSGTGAEEFERDLKAIENSSGAVSKAFLIIKESAGQTVDVGINKLTNALTDGLGKSIIESVANFDKATGAFDILSAGIQVLGENVGVVSAILTGLFLPSLAKAGVGIAALTVQMVTGTAAANGFGLSLIKGAAAVGPYVAAGALLVAVIYDLATSWEAVGTAAERSAAKQTAALEKIRQEAVEDSLKLLQVQQSRLTIVIRNSFQQNSRDIAEVVGGLSKEKKELSEQLKAIQDTQKEAITQALDNFDSRIERSKKGVSDLESQLKSLTASIQGSEKTIADTLIEQQLNNQVTNTGKRGVFNKEITKLKETGPLIDDDDAEEKRLKRIIELIRKRQALLNTRATQNAGFIEIIEAETSLLNFNKAQKVTAEVSKKTSIELLKTAETNKANLEIALKIVEAKTKEYNAIKNIGKESAKLKKIGDARLAAQKEVERLTKVGGGVKGTSTGGSASAIFSQISTINTQIASESVKHTRILSIIASTGNISILSRQVQKLIATNETSLKTIQKGADISEKVIKRVVPRVQEFGSTNASFEGKGFSASELNKEIERVKSDKADRKKNIELLTQVVGKFEILRDTLKSNDPAAIQALALKTSSPEALAEQGTQQKAIAEILKSSSASTEDTNLISLLGTNIVKMTAILQSTLSQDKAKTTLGTLESQLIKQSEKQSGNIIDISKDPNKAPSQIEIDKQLNQSKIFENATKKVTDSLGAYTKASTGSLTRNTQALHILANKLDGGSAGVTIGDINITAPNGVTLDKAGVKQILLEVLPRLNRQGVLK